MHKSLNSKDLLQAFRTRGLKLVTAESCTGGLLGASLTEISGSSDVYDRGFITYSNDAKAELIGVCRATIKDHGAVSEAVAAEMATGALARSKADVAISITGIAGPGASDHKPEGRVCFGLAFKDLVQVETVEFGALGREKVRNAAAAHAIRLLHKAALNIPQ